MLSKETNDIKEIIQAAKEECCEVIKTIKHGNKEFAFITDAFNILIVSEDDHIVVPIEMVPEIIDNLKLSAMKAIEYASNFTMTDKAIIAKEKGLTYGKYKSKMYQVEEYCKRTYL